MLFHVHSWSAALQKLNEFCDIQLVLPFLVHLLDKKWKQNKALFVQDENCSCTYFLAWTNQVVQTLPSKVKLET